MAHGHGAAMPYHGGAAAHQYGGGTWSSAAQQYGGNHSWQQQQQQQPPQPNTQQVPWQQQQQQQPPQQQQSGLQAARGRSRAAGPPAETSGPSKIEEYNSGKEGVALLTDAYEDLTQVGEGTYGKVYKAKHRGTGELVALKKIRIHRRHDGIPLNAVREIRLLKTVRHPNLVLMHEIVISAPECGRASLCTRDRKKKKSQRSGGDGAKKGKAGAGLSEREKRKAEEEEDPKAGHIYMVFEYVDHDLAGLLDVMKDGSARVPQLSKRHVMCYTKQLVNALTHLHQKNWMHRDIKCSNLLVTRGNVIKLADFGLARMRASAADEVTGEKPTYTNKVITLWYRPPELLLGAKMYGQEVDMWSLGCILAELLIQKPLFSARTEAEQVQLIFSICGSPTNAGWPEFKTMPYAAAMRPKTPMPRRLEAHIKEMSKKANSNNLVDLNGINMVDALLILNPKHRLDAQGCLRHRFLKNAPEPHELPELHSVDHECGFHEWQTKQERKRKREKKLKQDAAEAKAKAEELKRKAKEAKEAEARAKSVMDRVLNTQPSSSSSSSSSSMAGEAYRSGGGKRNGDSRRGSSSGKAGNGSSRKRSREPGALERGADGMGSMSRSKRKTELDSRRQSRGYSGPTKTKKPIVRPIAGDDEGGIPPMPDEPALLGLRR